MGMRSKDGSDGSEGSEGKECDRGVMPEIACQRVLENPSPEGAFSQVGCLNVIMPLRVFDI
jgi:hypothetical protein